MTSDEAIRTSLIRAARERRRREELAAEVGSLEADDGDRTEMLAVAGLMEAMHAAR